ncbi:hypothetical protein FIBSPDRAFT_1037602 [Athelia psychrophila]|uniref:CN hydrolase domain-containing protein n=1 Tax=Athelia psychrophila TaxID=1759441 RepID=A0A166TYN3_9AGAM|nr:hypothetical protein FIBSPDRAFT_1037602 [Fibularhizoctonia sp. CBS 109695]
MSLQSIVHSTHPQAIFNGAAVVLSLAALTSTPSFWPLVLTLSTAHVYLTIIHKRTHFVSRLLVFWLSLSFGASFSNASTALDALSTPALSLIVLLGMAALQSAIALLVVFVGVRASGMTKDPWAQLLLFPALWTSVWAAVAHLSPLGRLIMWSPATGLPAYAWLTPIAGPLATDWTVAAAAAVLSRIAGSWLMGPAPDDDDEPGPLIVEFDQSQPAQPPLKSQPKHLLTLTTLLLLLTAPSFFPSPALPISSLSTTRVNVGCVLPSPIYDKPKHGSPDTALEHYIAASEKLRNSAHLLVWPESAVTFNTVKEREEAFAAVIKRVHGPAVGVSFEEYLPAEDGGRAGMRRNGFALINGDSVAFTYFKQHLVPIAESFAVTPSLTPPPLTYIAIPPPKGVTPTDWSPIRDHNGVHSRPLPLSALICLDSAHPSSLLASPSLSERPALVLVPAKTWESGVGEAMWAQARARAAEVGAGAVWCDGGAGGIAGVSSPSSPNGYEYEQRGAGSFVVSVPVAWPFDAGRTVYARAGAWMLFVPWGLLGVGWATDAFKARGGLQGVKGGVQGAVGGVVGGVARVVQAWRRGRAARGEDAPLLQ